MLSTIHQWHWVDGKRKSSCRYNSRNFKEMLCYTLWLSNSFDFFPCLTIKSRHEYYSAVPRKQLTHAQYTRSMLVVLQIPMLMIPKKLTDSRTEYKAKLAGIAMVEHNRNLFLFCSLQELRLAFICLYFAISLHLLNRFVLNFNLFF